MYVVVEIMREDIRDGLPEDLAQLIATDGATGAGGWQSSELGDIFVHQLAVPLRTDLVRLGPVALSTPQLCAAPWASRTFGELLTDPAPPLALLRLVKDFAKASGQGDLGLPGPVSLGLYYAAIAVALVRHGVAISTLNADELRGGIRWALAADWLDPALRSMFEAALATAARLWGPPPP